jgi:hypothetical protein
MMMKKREKITKTGSGLGTDNVMQETLKKGGVFLCRESHVRSEP